MTFKILLLSQTSLMTPCTTSSTDIWFHYDVAFTSSASQPIKQILHKHCRLIRSIRTGKKGGRGNIRVSFNTCYRACAPSPFQIVCAFPVILHQRYDRWEMPNTPNCGAVRTGLYTEQRKLRGARDLHFWATEFK